MPLLISRADARDIALLFSYDCRPEGQFGATLHNERQVLGKFGWDVRFFCGRGEDSGVEPQRIHGNLVRNRISLALQTLDLKPGDNLLVSFTTHGDQFPDEPDRQILVMGEQRYDRQKSETFLETSKVLGQLLSLDLQNREGLVILVNSSCFSGNCLRTLPPVRDLCVMTISPEGKVGYTGNWYDLAFLRLAGPEGRVFRVSRSYPEDSFFESAPQSSRLKDLWGFGLQHDSVSLGVYSSGYGIDDLNRVEPREFYERFSARLDTSNPATNELSEAWQALTARIDGLEQRQRYERNVERILREEFQQKYWRSLQIEMLALPDGLRWALGAGSPLLAGLAPPASARLRYQGWEEVHETQVMATQELLFPVAGSELEINRFCEAYPLPFPLSGDCRKTLMSLAKRPDYLEDTKRWAPRVEIARETRKEISEELGRLDGQLHRARNRLMAEALFEAHTPCGEFDLDRRPVGGGFP